MTPRQRYFETILFGSPDKIPLSPGGPRESTLAKWFEQGLDRERSWFDQLLEAVGIDPATPIHPPAVGCGASFRMIPEFEERIIEHRDGHYILQDWMGAIVEISDRYDATYIRSAKDFVTRKWYKFPVQSRDDWEAMKERYNPDTPERYAADFDERLAALNRLDRDEFLAVGMNGPFWQLREWCGFEGLCVLFMDDPEFVHEMVDFWTEFVAEVLSRICARAPVDRILISEDMAYKAHSMISPAMTREFLCPAYRRWIEIAAKSGCRIFDVDSDGYIGELIPCWIDAGINVCDPIEVAAGNDIVEFRRRFGRRMAYTGGIDKRAIAKGGKVVEEEVQRVVPPLLEDGGFIPGCDHGVPPDISWPDFIYYTKLLAKLCGWL